MDCFKKVAKAEGPLGLYKGNKDARLIFRSDIRIIIIIDVVVPCEPYGHLAVLLYGHESGQQTSDFFTGSVVEDTVHKSQ